MSRCKSCDSIMKSSEMYTREVKVEGESIEIVEDLCTPCRRIIIGEDDENEDIIEMLSLDIIKGGSDDYS